MEELEQCRRCACSALYPTRSDLKAHHAEYRTREQQLLAQEQFILAELAKCRAHARACTDHDSDDESESGNHGDYGEAANATDGVEQDRNEIVVSCESKQYGLVSRECPVRSCVRNARPFPKRQNLRTHYRKHVACDEVCVYCGKRFSIVSTFVGHARVHESEQSEAKRKYTNQICEDLIKVADTELTLVESKTRETRKRSLDMADLESEITGPVDSSLVDSKIRGTKKRSREVAGTDPGITRATNSSMVNTALEQINDASRLAAEQATTYLTAFQAPVEPISAGSYGTAEAMLFPEFADDSNRDPFNAPISVWMNFPRLPDGSVAEYF